MTPEQLTRYREIEQRFGAEIARAAFKTVANRKLAAAHEGRKAALERRVRWVGESRKHLLPFVQLTHPGYLAAEFHRRVCAALERFSLAVAREESPRLILTAPPRHGKTQIVSVRFPAWHMALYPGHEVVCASYGQELADDNSRAAREVARSEEAVEAFPALAQVASDVDQVRHWTAGGSSYMGVGAGGPLTGRGAHILVVDDPVKDWEEANSETRRNAVYNWFLSTATTRLAPGGGIIVMATRWHDDDLTGRLLAAMAAGGEQWEVLHFEALSTGTIADDWREAGEALHPERYPATALEAKRGAMGATIFEALYQGRPIALGGGMFRASLWRRYSGNPRVLVRMASEVALTIDCANEGHADAAYSVLHVVAKFQTSEGPRVRVLAEKRGQWELPALIEAYHRALRDWPMIGPVYIEYAANGIALCQLARGARAGVIAVKPRGDESYPGGDKVTRAQYTLQALESGVGPELPEDAYALSESGENFAVGIINEHAQFPAAKLKDRVDTLSQYMIRVLVQSTPSIGVDARRAFFGL